MTIAAQVCSAVRDHAASTSAAPKAIDKQWENATTLLAGKDQDHFEKGKLKNQPDLFIAQLHRE